VGVPKQQSRQVKKQLRSCDTPIITEGWKKCQSATVKPVGFMQETRQVPATQAVKQATGTASGSMVALLTTRAEFGLYSPRLLQN
jgi:hypothetical protein